MTLSYNIGLTAGSLVAYLLEAMLGPQVSNPCGSVYPTIGSVTRAIYTTPANLTSFIEVTTTATLYSTVVNQNTYYVNSTEGISSFSESSMNTIYTTVSNNITSSVSSPSVLLYSILNHLSSTASWSDE